MWTREPLPNRMPAVRPVTAVSGQAGTRDNFLRRILMGRMGAPDEIATVVLFLVSRAASYMTGSLVVVDGGCLAG
jgi:NAD(P)-dependent dehydrogenase (short-subunit alcohol dehydrogenase family)